MKGSKMKIASVAAKTLLVLYTLMIVFAGAVDQAVPDKITLTTQELVDQYERDRDGMKYVVELKIKEVEEALEQCDSRRRRAKLERELGVLKKKKEEYEKPLGRRTAVQQAKRHYGMDR